MVEGSRDFSTFTVIMIKMMKINQDEAENRGLIKTHYQSTSLNKTDIIIHALLSHSL